MGGYPCVFPKVAFFLLTHPGDFSVQKLDLILFNSSTALHCAALPLCTQPFPSPRPWHSSHSGRTRTRTHTRPSKQTHEASSTKQAAILTFLTVVMTKHNRRRGGFQQRPGKGRFCRHSSHRRPETEHHHPCAQRCNRCPAAPHGLPAALVSWPPGAPPSRDDSSAAAQPGDPREPPGRPALPVWAPSWRAPLTWPWVRARSAPRPPQYDPPHQSASGLRHTSSTT